MILHLICELTIYLCICFSPDFAAAWMNRGIVKASLKKHSEAEASYREATRHRRNYPDCYYNLGNLVVIKTCIFCLTMEI